MNREHARKRDVKCSAHGARGGAGDMEPSVAALVGQNEHTEPAGVDKEGFAEVHDDRAGLGDGMQGVPESRRGDQVDLALDSEDCDGRLVHAGDAEAGWTCWECACQRRSPIRLQRLPFRHSTLDRARS